AAWTNPFTGDVRTTGFWDLYDQAQYKAKSLIAAFDQPGFTVERTRELTGELDFSGRPTQAQLLAVE
ncbi:MAG: peptidase, partial [Senegalimassilia anaerobia]|nr:peptidase [Senegalimassilia anaerobia]